MKGLPGVRQAEVRGFSPRRSGLRAWLNTRHAESKAAESLKEGLERIGCEVVQGLTMVPGDADLLLTWNRIRAGDTAARAFEAAGRPVLVVENAAWGNGFNGQRWLSLARTFHNTAGTFPLGDDSRWDALGVDLAEWRRGGETVVLPQRGIGPREVAMPRGWTAAGRIRPHPGRAQARPLEEDLKNCDRVVTWGSGAAVKALMWGIPVESHMPGWIGEQDNTDAGRLAMFRRLAWAQWTIEELATGEPMKRLLG